ncbi:MAG TPA: glucuronate isomerase, partial [Chloroflexota bacterium]|nr:glucuronate isomerase [Chloroflexota bacterium]
TWRLSPDRCFDADPAQREQARELYSLVKDLSILSPHGHVDPALLANPNAAFGTPADLLIVPDHYVFRLLHSQGVALADLGVPSRDGTPVETDHRRIWQRFADHFFLFRGTPTGLWLSDELTSVFEVEEKLNGANAQAIYDHLETRLARPEFTPRALWTRFRIEELCTTDPATSTLADHLALRDQGWGGRVRPTFRPDAVVNLADPQWGGNMERLGTLAGMDIVDHASYIRALETRRASFKQAGAVATDHAARTPHTERLSPREADQLLGRAFRGEAMPEDAARFTAHMLIEFARMSAEDGLVMQLHVGSFRDHSDVVFQRFGPDKGADIPVRTNWTEGLRTVLNAYGNDPRFRLILFTLDESTYSRELAPLAGFYPAVFLGPPWWFFDSVQGMNRFLDSVIETAGLYNLAGFNDDTRAFCSIPARHDVWRRVSANWLAGQVVRGLIDREDAAEMVLECAQGLARRAYRLV